MDPPLTPSRRRDWGTVPGCVRRSRAPPPRSLLEETGPVPLPQQLLPPPAPMLVSCSSSSSGSVMCEQKVRLSRPSAAPSADRRTLHFSKGQGEGLCPRTPGVFLQRCGDPVFHGLPFVRRWQNFWSEGSRHRIRRNRLLGVRGVMNPDLGLNRHPTSPPPALWDL